MNATRTSLAGPTSHWRHLVSAMARILSATEASLHEPPQAGALGGAAKNTQCPCDLLASAAVHQMLK